MKLFAKIDPYSKNKFYTHSSIKKFENRQNQLNYNNWLKKEKRERRAFVVNKIENNYKILSMLLNGKSSLTIPKSKLEKAKFNFNVITHYYHKNDKTILCVYEYSFFVTDDDKIKIEKDGRINDIA